MVIAAVTRHQKKENHDEKVAGIKILGQQPPQKTADALLGPGLWLGKGRTVWRSIATGAVLWRTGGRFWWLRRWWLGERAVGALRRLWIGPGRIGDPVSAIGAVWLRNITVIHGCITFLSEFDSPGTKKGAGHAGHFCCPHGFFQLSDSFPA